jgi:MoaA/NifB/PqqE/SkfB family radical SAM enzyme
MSGMNNGMQNNLLEMPFLKNIGLLMTYKCQVTCPHCIIEAGPHRKEEISLGDAFNWIEQISEYRNNYIRVLALTGGEPFYNLDSLKKISDFGGSKGLFVSVITNAFWASSKKEAISILKDLKSINMLSFSTDVYHLKSIPFGKIKNAITAAKKCDVPYTISVCTEDKNDIEYRNLMRRLTEITEKDAIVTAITFRAGRALKKLKNPRFRMSKEPPIAACSAGSSPIIFPDGRVLACIGPVIDLPFPHPLVLGNMREESLLEILDRAESNAILHAIRVWGPRKLISILEEAGLSQFLPDKYIEDSICMCCYSLLSNSQNVNFLNKLSEDFEFKRKVAYARVYYLNETEMAKFYQSEKIHP